MENLEVSSISNFVFLEFLLECWGDSKSMDKKFLKFFFFAKDKQKMLLNNKMIFLGRIIIWKHY